MMLVEFLQHLILSNRVLTVINELLRLVLNVLMRVVMSRGGMIGVIQMSDCLLRTVEHT